MSIKINLHNLQCKENHLKNNPESLKILLEMIDYVLKYDFSNSSEDELKKTIQYKTLRGECLISD